MVVMVGVLLLRLSLRKMLVLVRMSMRVWELVWLMVRHGMHRQRVRLHVREQRIGHLQLTLRLLLMKGCSLLGSFLLCLLVLSPGLSQLLEFC